MAAHFPLLAGATLLLLLLSLSHSQSLTTDEDEDDYLVIDMVGNPVEVGSEYYILPISFEQRGGLTTSPKPDSELGCPLYVVESPSEIDLGKPVSFIPTDSTHTQIHLSSDLSIDSGFDDNCTDEGLWRLSINPVSRWFEVVANGAFDVPLADFQIRKGSKFGAYVLSYCHDPTLRLRQDQEECDNFGIFTDNSAFKVLGYPTNSTTNEVLQVSFLKKDDDNLAHRASH